jgi:DNA-directed RNA polymerase subunit RPC12/RpoP
MMHEAVHTITCSRCGGAIALDRLQPRVRCPYCRHDEVIPPEQLAALAGYRESADVLARRIDAEQRERARWELFYRADGRPRGTWLAPLLLALPILLLSLGGIALVQARVIEEATLSRVLPASILGVYFLGLAGYVGSFLVRRARRSGAGVHVGAACPRCGGPLAFAAGAVVQACAHCGASLAPGTSVMAQAIDAARADLRREAMARYRLERRAMASVNRVSGARWTPYYVLGSFLPMTAGGAISFTVDYVTNEKTDTPAGGLAVLWLLALANAGAILFVVRLRKARRDRWRSVASAVAARLGGDVVTTMDAWVAWLDTLWAGPYAVARLLSGPYFCAATGRLGAYTVAVVVDPVPASSEHQTAYAEVLLPATLPDEDGALVPADLKVRAEALGVAPSACSGGLVAEITSPALARLKRSPPAASAALLVETASVLGEWAARIGAAPAAPIP